MNIREYIKLTKKTTNNCLKICGVIFTSIYAVIAIISGFKNESISDSIEIFIICFLLGNGLGLFIWFLAIITAYGQVRTIIKFYDSIPDKIIKKFGLLLVAKPLNPKYNYLQLEILDTKSETPVLFNFDNKFVSITIINDLSNIENFQRRMFEIQKKYKKERISLSVLGLRKHIKRKDWQMFSDEEVDKVIDKLKSLSNEENIEIVIREI